VVHLQPSAIIVVGDDPSFVYLMQRYARESAHRVMTIHPYEDVLAIIRREQPVAIVLELDTPTAATQQLLERLRSSPDTSAIPTIVCTWTEDRDLAIESDTAAVCLHKPVLYADFLSALSLLGIEH